MKRFEYKVVRTGSFTLKADKLNEYGKQGWELVTSMYMEFNYEYVFKKELTA